MAQPQEENEKRSEGGLTGLAGLTQRRRDAEAQRSAPPPSRFGAGLRRTRGDEQKQSPSGRAKGNEEGTGNLITDAFFRSNKSSFRLLSIEKIFQ